MRLLLSTLLLIAGTAHAAPGVPKLKLEYSYALDMFCPENVVPEYLKPAELALIPKLADYRDKELLGKMSWLQAEWDRQGIPLMAAALNEVRKPFPMREISAAVFLCPRYPFMGTPLALNAISYLDSSAKDIPALGGKPMPVFFFVSTTFHEVLHKYIDSILSTRPSATLKTLGTSQAELYGAHLHLFALQKEVFTDLGLAHLLPSIGALEASHGPEYKKAWDKVHGNPMLQRQLVDELR